MDALIHKPLIAHLIAVTLMVMRMDFAIDFSAELCLGAIEIENVRTKRMLVTEDNSV
jgi:hypothetical protein